MHVVIMTLLYICLALLAELMSHHSVHFEEEPLLTITKNTKFKKMNKKYKIIKLHLLDIFFILCLLLLFYLYITILTSLYFDF